MMSSGVVLYLVWILKMIHGYYPIGMWPHEMQNEMELRDDKIAL
jgi:hypothetical protein